MSLGDNWQVIVQNGLELCGHCCWRKYNIGACYLLRMSNNVILSNSKHIQRLCVRLSGKLYWFRISHVHCTISLGIECVGGWYWNQCKAMHSTLNSLHANGKQNFQREICHNQIECAHTADCNQSLPLKCIYSECYHSLSGF